MSIFPLLTFSTFSVAICYRSSQCFCRLWSQTWNQSIILFFLMSAYDNCRQIDIWWEDCCCQFNYFGYSCALQWDRLKFEAKWAQETRVMFWSNTVNYHRSLSMFFLHRNYRRINFIQLNVKNTYNRLILPSRFLRWNLFTQFMKVNRK